MSNTFIYNIIYNIALLVFKKIERILCIDIILNK